MESPVKLLQQLRRRVQSVTYSSAIYRMMLDQGPVPDHISHSMTDPWPGDAKRGQALIASQQGLFEADPLSRGEPDIYIQCHEWLRDLRAVGSDLARRKAISMINDWMAENDTWREEGWEPEVLGLRLANWLSFYDFYSPVASDRFLRSLRQSMTRQLRHLLHAAPAHKAGLAGLHVVKGLAYGGLALIEGERALGLALELLKRQLEEEILPDGGVISRSPERHAQMLRVLIDLRTLFKEVSLEIPHELSLTIVRMVPVLKFYRHGDGRLVVFHGGGEGESLMVEAILTLSETRGRILKRLPHTGYERLTAGRSLLLADVAGPAPRGFDEQSHAGLLSFEFSVGKERLIVNCGAGPAGDPEWQRAMAATAAHSTITVADTNACELLPEEGIGHRPRKVTVQRYEQNEVQFIETSHDGYQSRHKTMVQRLLGLTKDGEQLLGRDVVESEQSRDFVVRWHLHPSVTVLLSQGGKTALLRTASGAGWRFKIESGHGIDLALEASVYCGDGGVRRTMQLCASGRTEKGQAVVEWTLTREAIKK